MSGHHQSQGRLHSRLAAGATQNTLRWRIRSNDGSGREVRASGFRQPAVQLRAQRRLCTQQTEFPQTRKLIAGDAGARVLLTGAGIPASRVQCLPRGHFPFRAHHLRKTSQLWLRDHMTIGFVYAHAHNWIRHIVSCPDDSRSQRLSLSID